MNFFRCLLGMSLVFVAPSLLAQTTFKTNNDIKPLQIGDIVPDITLSGIQNYIKKTAKFSDFKNKLVIIDFWFGACPGCIEAFPKMEALQQKFGDKLQILMVNFESEEKIKETFSKHRKISPNYRNPKLPSLINDTIFHKLFSFQYYPHEVWIDGNGIVKAFTSMDEVTESNIQAMIEKKPLKMDMKIDHINFNDLKYPILTQVYDKYPNHLKYYSTIINFVPGISGGTYGPIIDTVFNTARLSRKNMPILTLFGYAINQGLDGNPFSSVKYDYGKRVVLQIRDSSRYFYHPNMSMKKSEWDKNNLYIYEAVLPIEQKDKMYHNMLIDLERFFNIKCRVEKRSTKCLALVKTSDLDKIKSKGKTRSFFDERNDSTKIQIYAGRTKYLVDALTKANINTPYVFADNTGYEGLIDIEFDKKLLSDIPALRKKLATYDLALIEKELPVDVLVLIENDFVNQKNP